MMYLGANSFPYLIYKPALKDGAIVGKFVVGQATNNGIGKRQGGVMVGAINYFKMI
jgi:hypothetical protein